jgi:hypothetical protein
MSFQHFIRDESGAVTVDWVVLTSGLVGLGLATVAVVSAGAENLTGDIAVHLASIDPGEGFFGSEDGGGGWVQLPQLNEWSDPVEMMQSYLDAANGDVQTAYDNLFRDAQFEAQNPNMNSGNEIDALGAFEAHAAANNLQYDSGTNPSYAELHGTYTSTQTSPFF